MEDIKMSEVRVDLMGSGQSDIANFFGVNGRTDFGTKRPFLYQDPKTGNWGAYVTVFKGGDPKKITSYQNIPMNVNAATLRRDEWKALDEAVMNVARERLVGIADLEANNLVYNLNNAMGTTVFEWHDVGDSMEATMTMDGVTRSKGDRPTFQHNYLPIPIIHSDYEINARVLAASRSLGNSLDTYAAENAARRIAEKLEDMLFTDVTYGYGETDARSRNTIYSYVNFPDKNDVVLAKAWDHSTKTGAEIIADVLAMKQASIDDYHWGPWKLYIPTAYETVLDEDYDTTTPGTTIRERILKISGISGITVVDRLAADNVLLIEMKSDTVRLIKGMALTNLQAETEFGFVNKYKILTIQVPQLRSDRNSRCGIVHMAAKAAE
jgi:hypothetical protein